MLIAKPTHSRYAFCKVNNVTYTDFAERYSACKRYGFRGVVAFATGTGTIGVVKEIVKGEVVQYGKRRFACFVVIAGAYICAPAVAVITKATKVVKTCKIVYTTVGYVFETAEDIGTIVFLPIDLALLVAQIVMLIGTLSKI